LTRKDNILGNKILHEHVFCLSHDIGGQNWKMGFIPEEKKELLKAEFKDKLDSHVKIVLFTREFECKFCSETRQIAQELAALDNRMTIEIYDFVANAEKAKEYRIDKIPAIAVIGTKDYGVRLFGVPFGYELRTFIDAVINVSRGKTDLSDKTKEVIAEIKSPVHIQVFVSLTCPHCPVAAAFAHKLAIESDMIRADVIDAQEFPQLSQKYTVMGVPKVVINEKVEYVGAFDEDLFAEQVLLGAYS
jgi:glutaredoxin-like protein